MANVHVRVQFGRDNVEVDISPERTFGDIRQQIEEQMGLVDEGVKLLYKGKQYGNSVTLCSVGIGASNKLEQLAPQKIETIKMIALRTKKQHESDKQSEKLRRLGETVNARTLEQFHDAEKDSRHSAFTSSSRGSSSHSAADKADSGFPHASSVGACHDGPPKPTTTVDFNNDGLPENMSSIFVSRGRNKYRIGVDLEGKETGGNVKERLCAMGGEWTGWTVKDIRLLAKGRVVSDDQILQDLGVRHGDTMMVLVSPSRHAAVDAAREMTTLSREIQTLSISSQSLRKRVRSRVLSPEDAIVQVEELKRECERLRSNLNVIENRSNSTEKDKILKLKADVEDVRSDLERLFL